MKKKNKSNFVLQSYYDKHVKLSYENNWDLAKFFMCKVLKIFECNTNHSNLYVARDNFSANIYFFIQKIETVSIFGQLFTILVSLLLYIFFIVNKTFILAHQRKSPIAKF